MQRRKDDDEQHERDNKQQPEWHLCVVVERKRMMMMCDISKCRGIYRVIYVWMMMISSSTTARSVDELLLYIHTFVGEDSCHVCIM